MGSARCAAASGRAVVGSRFTLTQFASHLDVPMIVSTPSDVRSVLAAIPEVIPNQIGEDDVRAADGRVFAKVAPATGRTLCSVVRSSAADVARAVAAARGAQPAWAALTVVK